MINELGIFHKVRTQFLLDCFNYKCLELLIIAIVKFIYL